MEALIWIVAAVVVILGIVAWVGVTANASLVKAVAQSKAKDTELVALLATEL